MTPRDTIRDLLVLTISPYPYYLGIYLGVLIVLLEKREPQYRLDTDPYGNIVMWH